MDKAIQVAAVVVTYNRRELLLQCVAALAAQTEPLTIWVIDNASTDGTEQAVRALGLPNLVYRNTGRNLGGAGGFAYGVKVATEAGYDALWLMDDDTIPASDALGAFLEADRALQGAYGWLSGRALTPAGEDQPMNRQRKTPYRDIEGYEGERIPCVMASFVSLFLRTDTVRKFGLPIADFFIWSDDWEYTRRISRQCACYTVPAGRAVHAMKNPGVVNIATDVPARWARYRYFYRNDVVLYRREGLRGWLWVIAKDLWHSVQVLTGSGGHRAERLRIITEGFWSGVHYHPEVEYLP